MHQQRYNLEWKPTSQIYTAICIFLFFGTATSDPSSLFGRKNAEFGRYMAGMDCNAICNQEALEDAIMGASERKRKKRGKRNGESGVESDKNNTVVFKLFVPSNLSYK